MVNLTAAGVLRKLALMKFCWSTGGDFSSRWRLARAFYLLAGDHGRFRLHDQMEIRSCVGESRPLRLTIRDQPADVIEFREIFFDREYRACANLGFEPSAIYDIGANVGLAAAYFRARWPNALIVGFESAENEYALAERNYARLGAARLFQVEAGQYDSESSGTQDPKSDDDNDAGMDSPVIRVRRLDSMIERCELPRPDLIKIDLEGRSLEVLEGLGDCLSKARGVLLETHCANSYTEGRSRLIEAGFAVEDEVARGDATRVIMALKKTAA